MTGRDRDRDRERAARSQASASARTNEYFVPKDGIDREVITADICRYLGNDALVRPGSYENPATGTVQPGYFITAYRNLTTEMIADLKNDSERWAAERRQTASRGQPSNVEYRSSTTHQSRQYYGPSETTPAVAQGYGSAPTYPSAGASVQQGVYDSGYPAQQYGQPAAIYATDTGYPAQGEYYVAGADLTVDQRPGRAPVQPAGTVPRSGQVQYTGAYQQTDPRGYSAYPGQSAPSPVQYAQGSGQQTSETYYSRGGYGDTASGIYDSRGGYADAGTYSQAQIPSSTTTSGSSRRDRDRESERESRHHRSSRR